MNRYSAVLFLDSYTPGSIRLSTVYGSDESLRTALGLLMPDFKYADFADKTIIDIRHHLKYVMVESPSMEPDFDAVRDKRMSELTPAQRDDAHELWIRNNVGWMGEYHQPKYEFLLKRLDHARAQATAPAPEVLPGATAEEILTVEMQSIVGEYDDPALVPECCWVKKNASFVSERTLEDSSHWEFIINLARDLADIPEKLKSVIQKARAGHMAYLVFHQG